jgi:transposase-like protein
MRISVRLPQVECEVYEELKCCAYAGCAGRHFKPHGVKGEEKAVRDLAHEAVKSYRWRCLRCNRTFRVYPRGVSHTQQTSRLKAITVLLYVLGLSYGAVADFLVAMGCAVSKTTVYNNVQAAGQQARRRQRDTVTQSGKRPVIGTDGTYVKVRGEQVGIQVVVDDDSGELLRLEIIVSENSEEVLAIVQEVMEEVEAEVMVSDDLDVYKQVADELNLAHQICRGHVKRNVEELAESIEKQLQRKEPLPEGVISSPERLREDLQTLRQLVRTRPGDAPDQLERLYHRYKAAPVPKKGQRHTAWYRWQRLTLDQRREDLDGTNNSTERLIGWWIKERYRTMRGYKRTQSIHNVATLTARMGVRSGRYDLTELYT